MLIEAIEVSSRFKIQTMLLVDIEVSFAIRTSSYPIVYMLVTTKIPPMVIQSVILQMAP